MVLSRTAALAAALVVSLLGAVASAAPKDAQADKAHSKAMEEAYLESRFDDSADILQKAIDACGAKGCTPKTKARLYIDLGTVLAGGQGKHDEAVAAFAEALKIDKSAALDPDYVKKEIQKAYDEAKARPAEGGGDEPEEGGDEGSLEHDPHPEQRINTPVPIHVVAPEKPKVSRVIVRYVGTGKSETEEKELDKAGKAYRGNIPCEATVEEGTLKYWIVAENKKGDVVGSAGSEDAPLSTEIKKAIEGKAPRWPGFAPPESCSAGTGRQCVDDSDCNAGETCSGAECLASATPTTLDDDDDDEGGKDLRRSWISVWVAPNLAMVSGDDVCSTSGQADGGFVCLRENGTHYLGTPTAGQANNVNFGFGLGPVALGLAYDHLIGSNFTLGGRVGFAIGGASATDDDGVSFIPVHLEARGALYFTKDPFASTGARPYVFLGAGMAQIDVPVDVEVLEDGEACEAEDPENFESPCTAELPDGSVEPRRQTLTAYKQAGLGFAALGFGIAIAPADPVAIHLGVRAGLTFPVLVPTVAPELAVAVGF